MNNHERYIKPKLVEILDKGNHSHWELINSDGDVLWTSWDTPFDLKKEIENYQNLLKKQSKELDELIEKYKQKLRDNESS